MSENPTARQNRGARRRSQNLRSAGCALTGSITYSHNMRIERFFLFFFVFSARNRVTLNKTKQKQKQREVSS